MIYDRYVHKISDGRWHCPFSPEWVERMRRAAKHCKKLTAEYIEMQLRSEVFIIELGPGNFLSGPQDSRGLPILPPEMCLEWWKNSRCEIYDYDSIPDVVVTNGLDDWPLVYHPSVLMA